MINASISSRTTTNNGTIRIPIRSTIVAGQSVVLPSVYNNAPVAQIPPAIEVAGKESLDRSTRASIRENLRTALFMRYLRRVVRDSVVDTDTADLGRQMWSELSKAANGRLRVPNAAPALGGQLLYTWDRGAHHLEVEIFPDAPSEFFYLNRETDEDWAADYNVGDSLPDGLLEKLYFFIVHDLPIAATTTGRAPA
jgi:hypothetical protein